MMDADDRLLDVLLVDGPEVYVREHRPMIGRAVCVPWWNVRGWLSRPIVPRVVTGDHDRDKASEGAWTPARFEGNRKRKENLIHAGALLVDVDEAGDVDRVASALAKYATINHSTYKSTPAAPRCRAVLLLAEPIDARTYEQTWSVVAAHLVARGFGVDASAKDAGRLGFLPCVRPGAEYRFATTDGKPLDARAVLAAQPPPPKPARRLPAPEHADAYARAALRRAADAVAGSSHGARHYALSREAFRLARPELSLDEGQIASALLPAFVVAAGERRAHEGVRTVRDAVRARRGAA
jgi:hypothetical protein